MREIRAPDEMRLTAEDARRAGRSIGLVPTMGYLHEGHLELARHARRENELVVMSLFVNPTQFGPAEDFDRYPRDRERDSRLAAPLVDVLFAPDVVTIYPDGPEGQQVWVDPGPLAEHLCGAARPGHFRGVATVVTKLFNMVRPDRAYFGQKDGQQAVIVSRVARDLAFPLEIRVIPTVREPDGLALSSRNVYLTPDERRQAPALFGALQAARRSIEEGERDAQRLERTVREHLGVEAPRARVDYVTVVDLEHIQPVTGEIGDALVAVAAYFGETRLIDNLIVRFEDGRPRFN